MPVDDYARFRWSLPNLFQLPVFRRIRSQMRIPEDYPVDFHLEKRETETDWEDVLARGYEISVDDEHFEATDEGLFYRGRRVLLYIRDQSIQYASKYNSGYKYHLTWCKTLEDMKQRGRLNKYVVSTNTDGYFQINFVSDGEIVDKSTEELHVCKNCLNALNWKGYSETYGRGKSQIYESFDLDEFFRYYHEDNASNFEIIPNQTDLTAPPNVYPPDWAVISRRYKSLKDMRCELCGRRFNSTRELHVHHRDGVKSNVNPSNLVVLCTQCHQKQHMDHVIRDFSIDDDEIPF